MEDKIKQLQELIDKELPKLQESLEALKKLNDLTGATKRAEEIREEIKRKGWNIIAKIYDPSINIQDPGAIPLFAMYKYIYEDMMKKGEI